jgi:hypothetical protein
MTVREKMTWKEQKHEESLKRFSQQLFLLLPNHPAVCFGATCMGLRLQALELIKASCFFRDT